MNTNLDEKGIAKSQGTLQILAEGIVQEAGPCDLPVLILIHDEFCGLSRGVNDQWVPGVR